MIYTEDEIKQCWDTLGFHDEDSFKAYYADRIKHGLKDEKELTLLAPENVNLKLFWQMCDASFSGSVAGYLSRLESEDERKQDIAYGNYLNYILALQTNMFSTLNQTTCVKHPIIEVLEIGPGFGALNPSLSRDGVINHKIDVYPRIDGCVESDGFTIPESVKEHDIMIVISSNVFQHLSIEQRRSYYREIASLLGTNTRKFGYFDFNLQCLGVNDDDRFIKHNDKYYITHMGMYTEITTPMQVQKDLLDAGFVVNSQTCRSDGMYGFSCLLNKTQKSA